MSWKDYTFLNVTTPEYKNSKKSDKALAWICPLAFGMKKHAEKKAALKTEDTFEKVNRS